MNQNDLQELIMRAPEEWLWFHRRWKTAPLDGEGERLYNSAWEQQVL